MITTEDLLKDSNEDEIFCLIGEFLHRARDKDMLSEVNMLETKRNNKQIGKTLILSDKQIISVIREMQQIIKGQVYL